MRLLHALCLLNCVVGSLATCSMEDDTCEFWLVIEHRLTMMDYKTAVYPAKGLLYKCDVLNTSQAQPVDPSGVITADGWESSRLVITANGTMPGPSIEVFEGQTVIVHVKNLLTGMTTSIHWHGLHQTDTPWMDGVAFITQCPILPGQTFTYKFKAYPKGTFWYHAHVGSQITMGLLGALIIREKVKTSMEEFIMLLQDWNHDMDGDLMHLKMVYGNYQNRQRIPPSTSIEGARFSMFPFQSGLVNGKGRVYYPNGSHNEAPLTVYTVKSMTSYRFRVIGASSLHPFRVSIDEHAIKLLASDGYELQPVVVESFIINSGERYDFEIVTNQTEKNYWIRAQTLEVNVSNHIALAILRYQGAPDEDPTTERRNCTDLDRCLVVNCPFSYYPEDTFTDCKPVGTILAAESSNVPGTSRQQLEDVEEIFLNFAFPGTTWTPGSVNGRTFQHNKVYQMILVNMGDGRGWAHPVHMHGHSFYVLKQGYPQYNRTTGKVINDNTDIDCGGNRNGTESFCNAARWANASWGGNNVPGLHLESPPRKDTIMVPTGGYVVLRIRADNPGLWIIHCHVELHMMDGMALLLNESFSNQPPPPTGFPRCGSFNFDKHQETHKHEGENNTYTEFSYWLTTGCLLAVVVILLIIIILLCCRFRTNHKGKLNINNEYHNHACNDK
ncbi:unnamed protein product [Candidula unifasciata]|uniref:Laccase n=1 Tax=Candidula unifasciata TaxID=100452 RepID=A0A8S4A352_9EUPU|nr:unnamed protein product [Candidula unifasciata]